MKKKTYLWCCDIYIRLAYRTRSILKLLECRGGSEGSTEDHYSIRALARYITPLLSLKRLDGSRLSRGGILREGVLF